MAVTIDTLGFVKHLRDAGVPDKQAEAHAEAVRDFIMTEIATRHDISRLESKIDAQPNAITLRIGSLVVVGLGVLFTLLKLS